jgi:hypothetical protein
MAQSSFIAAGVNDHDSGFYLELAGDSDLFRAAGRACYGVAAILIVTDAMLQWRRNRWSSRRHGKLILDMGIAVGCVISLLAPAQSWSTANGLCGLVCVPRLCCASRC